jgi:3-hydroxymyristoyl/3-hydroxydecanoyl-(acyl carrier protein) dehydratase
LNNKADMPSVPLNIAVDHPVFTGHFPGRPIVPGVLLLDAAQLEVESAIGHTVFGIASAKFLSPTVPGDRLSLAYEFDGTAVRFDIRCETRKVASGRFDLAQVSPA